MLRRLGKTLELEVTPGVLVITVAGILASVSPPVRTEILRLTNGQVTTLLTPHWPRTDIANPETFSGHFTGNQELTNLIDMQHAVFGTFGLFAGVVRWLSLRGLFPLAVARPLWPSLVVGLGFYMAFCYREDV